MGRKPKPEHKKKVKQIKFYVTETEKLNFDLRKARLLELSPALSANEIFVKVSQNIDDLSLIQFLSLRADDPIKMKLLNDYLFCQLDND